MRFFTGGHGRFGTSWARGVRAARARGRAQGRRAAALDALEPRRLLAVQVAGFVDEFVEGGMGNLTAMAFAPDGRIFALEQSGTARVIVNGERQSTPFVDLVVDSSGERGLLGVAFDPDYAANRYVYFYHTVPAGAGVGPAPHNRVTRFTADAVNPNVAQPGSATTILNLDPLSGAMNHNGGAIHFGADGKLYVATGENANPPNSQTLANTHGKMLRVNPDGTAPADNPFFTDDAVTQSRDYIWALGLRNPFTFAVDPEDGLIHINDVGQSAFEEIDVGRRGANYGWPSEEGPEDPPNPNFDDPLFAYPRTGPNDETGTVIAGGAFYRRPAGAASPFPDAFDGDYFYADAGHGWIRWLDDNTASSSLIDNNVYGIVDLKVGPDGSLYYLSRNTGAVRRLRYTVQPPGAPDLTTDTGANAIDNLTRDDTPTFVGSAPNGATVRIYAGGVEVGSAVASGGQYSVTTAPLASGAHAITAKSTVGGVESASSAALAVTIDTAGPQAGTPTHLYQTSPQRIRIAFTEDVAASVAAGDMLIVKQDSTLPYEVTGVAWDGNVATFALPAGLPDGDYRATVAAGNVTDAAGNPLAAGVTFDFFVFAGDATHDRKVDFSDLVALAQNYNTLGGMTFDKGDFNYDGDVDFDDLVILAQAYNTELPTLPPPAPVPVPVMAGVAVRARSAEGAVFSTTPVKRPVAAAAGRPKAVARASRG